MPSHELVGPGQLCPECHEGYGQHKAKCTVPKRQQAMLDKGDEALGRTFLSAITENNALEIGRLIRTRIVSPK